MQVAKPHVPCGLSGRGVAVKFPNVASASTARLLAAGLALQVLTACSSIHNQSVAAGGLFVPLPPKAGYATVYIGRPFTFHTSVFALPIQVDDKPLTSLPPGQYTAVQLSPGPHSVSSPNEYWTRVISGVPHPANFTVEAGKAYYLLPKRWGEDAGYSVTMVGSVAVPHKTAIAHSTFTVQAAAASAAPPSEFDKLSYAKAP